MAGKRRQGKITAEIGRQLVTRLSVPNYGVYYDHGAKDKDSHHVRESQAFLDSELCTNATKIAAMDIMVYEKGDQPDGVGRARWLIEIEESYSPPKKLFGDIMAFLLTKIIRIKHKGRDDHFTVDCDTKFVVATWRLRKGNGDKKLERLRRRLNENWPDRITLLCCVGETKDEAKNSLADSVMEHLTHALTSSPVPSAGSLRETDASPSV